MKADLEDARAVVGIVVGLQNHRARAIAEDHAHVPAPVRDFETRRMHFAPEDEDPSKTPRADHRVGEGKSVEKAAALCAQVDARNFAGLESLVQEEGSPGKFVLRGEGREENAVHVANLEACVLESLARSRLGQ